MSAPDLASQCEAKIYTLVAFNPKGYRVEQIGDAIRATLAASADLRSVEEALELLDKLKANCQGDIGWRGQHNAIVDDYRVRHVLAVERALEAIRAITGRKA